jgi:hypothetical protein
MMANVQDRRRSGAGGVVVKRCDGCDRPVLSVYRGAISPMGKARIELVQSNGNVIARCVCGGQAAWIRTLANRPVAVTAG